MRARALPGTIQHRTNDGAARICQRRLGSAERLQQDQRATSPVCEAQVHLEGQGGALNPLNQFSM